MDALDDVALENFVKRLTKHLNDEASTLPLDGSALALSESEVRSSVAYFQDIGFETEVNLASAIEAVKLFRVECGSIGDGYQITDTEIPVSERLKMLQDAALRSYSV